MEDPFQVVKDEVQHSLNVVHELHKRWKEILKSATGKESEEYEWTKGELLSGLRSIEWDLQDLEETIGIVQSNRAKFGLSDAEVDARKHFVESTRASIATIRAEVSSAEPAKVESAKPASNSKRAITKKAGTERESLLASDSASVSIKVDKDAHADNSRFIGDEHAKQQMIMSEQDTQLDVISSSVGRLKEIGQEINSELKVQDKLLDEIGDQADSASAQMRNSMKALTKLAQDSDKGKLIVIFVLSLILFGLCYAIFS